MNGGDGRLRAASAGTIAAKALDDEVDAPRGEALGERDAGDMHLLKAKCTVARLAVEMRVEIVHLTVTLAAAQGILQRPRAVVDGMDEMVAEEERKGAEESRLIDRHEAVFQVEEREGAVGEGQLLQHEQANGRRLDVAAGQQFQISLFFRHRLCVGSGT